MGKSKFIDKKKAVQYRLVHRPSEETGLEHEGAEGSHVFERVDRTELPSPLMEGEEAYDEEYEDEYDDEDEDSPEYSARLAAYEARRRELLELGFPDDGYDYLRHLRVIKRSTGAMFMPVEKPRAPENDVKLYDASKARATSMAPTDEEALLVGAEATTRQLRRQPQQLAEGLDPEVAAALEDEGASDDGSSALLEDDFIALAMGDLDESAGEGTSAGEAHWSLRAAEQAAASDSSSGEGDVRWEDDSTSDAAATAMGSGSQEPGKHMASRPSRLLDDQFEQLALREYDSEDMGELDEGDPSARNTASISQYSLVLDEFLSNPDVTAVDYELKFPSMDTATRSKAKPSSRLPDVLENETLDTQQDLANDGASTSSGEDEIVRVEAVEPEEQWDCESAVTMLSNLDNHPGRISERSRAPRQAPPATIHLIGKHQLPAGFEGSFQKPHAHVSSQSASHKASSQASAPPVQRRRDESAEERKARKAEVKAARRDARATKKSLKTLFKDAEKVYKGAKPMPSTIPVA